MHNIDKIRESFIKESQNSPILLADLASMENYISESYSGRSFIELLQNADDVGASVFYIEALNNNQLLVANNGRQFTEEDFVSLCRSGASTKCRKGNTIGFRGIGFKSVINYSEEVYLFSGDYQVKFSKVLTKSLLRTNANVPLIRIPHYIEQTFTNEKVSDLRKKFNTVFLFKTKNSAYIDELDEFNSSSMLFLRNVEKIIIRGIRNYECAVNRRQLSDGNHSITFYNENNVNEEEWLVLRNNDSAFAFKFDNNVVIPAEADESLVYSFMPTKERLSIPAKINGDFSTDPSRTKVVYDEDTYLAIKKCVELILNYISKVKTTNADHYNILNILSYASIDPLSKMKGKAVNDILIEELKNRIARLFGDKVCLKPDFMEKSDYLIVAKTLGFDSVLDNDNNTSLSKFLKCMAMPTCSLRNALKAMTTLECSELTRIKTIVEIVKETRFGIATPLSDYVFGAKLFTTKNGVRALSAIKAIEDIDDEFLEKVVAQLNSFKDLENLLKKFDIKSSDHKEISADFIARKKKVSQQQTFSKVAVIPKWRSVEKNVATVLESLPEVSMVKDVSEQNLGYDLEVILKNGEHQFVEIKSVDSLGESFALTNNEYSTANQYGNQFFLAITCQTDSSIEVCLINNPVNNLKLTKRVVRWEWLCNQYTGKVIKKKFE